MFPSSNLEIIRKINSLLWKFFYLKSYSSQDCYSSEKLKVLNFSKFSFMLKWTKIIVSRFKFENYNKSKLSSCSNFLILEAVYFNTLTHATTSMLWFFKRFLMLDWNETVVSEVKFGNHNRNNPFQVQIFWVWKIFISRLHYVLNLNFWIFQRIVKCRWTEVVISNYDLEIIRNPFSDVLTLTDNYYTS